MRSVTVIALLAVALEAQAELKMEPLHHADFDNTTLGVYNVGKLGPSVIARPILQGLPTGLRLPQQRLSSYGIDAQREFPQAFHASMPYGRMTVVGAEKEAKAEEKAPEGPKNIYGEKLQKCSSSEDCDYNGPDSPSVCATDVTRDYSPPKNSFKWQKNEGTDAWKSSMTGKCVTIWDIGTESGFFGQQGIQWREKEQWYGTQYGFVPTDFLVKCDALPADVLTSKFSTDTFQQCYIESRQYKYVASESPAYKADNSYKTIKDTFKIDKPSLGETQPDNLSQKCFRFRAAIENICSACAGQTSKASGKDNLVSLCSAIQGTQLPSEMELIAETTPEVLSYTTTFLISLFAGSALVMAALRFRRGAPTAAQEPLLVMYN